MGGVGAAGGLPPVAQSVAAPAANQVVAAAFERLRGAAVQHPGTPVERLVSEAVGATLETQLGELTLPLRERMTGQITQVLLDDPVLRARLDRLMGADT